MISLEKNRRGRLPEEPETATLPFDNATNLTQTPRRWRNTQKINGNAHPGTEEGLLQR